LHHIRHDRFFPVAATKGRNYPLGSFGLSHDGRTDRGHLGAGAVQTPKRGDFPSRATGVAPMTSPLDRDSMGRIARNAEIGERTPIVTTEVRLVSLNSELISS
jgi:hypothetical protein